jgi:hypothetical protein
MADKPGIHPLNRNNADEQQMQQIREILFGDHKRHTDEQLARLEGRLAEQDGQLRELFESRLAQALEALRSEIDTQANRQQLALDSLDNALRALLGKADERITLLDSDLQDSHHRLSQSLAGQADALDALAQRSVEREALAGLLEQMARQLRTAGSQ